MSLRERHARLDRQIDDAQSRTYKDSVTIQRLKFEKLRVKEELDRLVRQ
ncbi:YdcH family protein [Rhodocista pekingensis]|uniref:YdcH family protein n=1 Tax=Rhodocista pekingensis TaxID=201185 RepID=A0ABW2KVD9_9PROT